MRYIRPFIPLFIWTLLILLLPAMGAWFSGQPLAEYLRFPLEQPGWDPLPYSARYYWSMLGLTAILLLGIARFAWSSPNKPSTTSPDARQPVSAWGWLGFAGLPGGLLLAAGGNASAGLLLFYIALLLSLNADTLRRTGHCLMTERPGYFLALLPGSALCGWLMHYLNLYTQNWYYPTTTGWSEGSAFASLFIGYSVLLPLLLSLRQWLASFPRVLRPLMHGRSLSAPPADTGWLLLGAAALALSGASLWSDYIYPLTWAAPLLLALSISMLAGRATPLSGLPHGDWSRPVLTGLAALLLGVLDRLWNSLFDALWSPSLPLLQGVEWLGLPLPAYSQYLCFGLIGLWIGDQLISPWQDKKEKRFPDFPVKITIK